MTRNPSLYQVNTRVWLTALSRDLGRAATLDDPSCTPPDIHIHTASKLPWLPLPDGARSYAGMYDVKSVWPADKLARLRADAAKHAAPSSG